jgi:hypothetical protein
LVLKAIGTPDEAATLVKAQERVATLLSRYPLPYQR